MAKATWLAVFLSFVGTALVATTLLVTVRTSRRELRAYVMMDTANVFRCDDPHGIFVCQVKLPEQRFVAIAIKNFGTTPAHNVSFKLGTAIRPFPWHETPPWPDDEPYSTFDLAPGRERTSKVEVANSSNMHPALSAGEQMGVYAWGTVEYEDTFRRKHKTHLRLVCVGQGYTTGVMASTEDGNDSD